jgi:hypothetical protein
MSFTKSIKGEIMNKSLAFSARQLIFILSVSAVLGTLQFGGAAYAQFRSRRRRSRCSINNQHQVILMVISFIAMGGRFRESKTWYSPTSFKALNG